MSKNEMNELKKKLAELQAKYSELEKKQKNENTKKSKAADYITVDRKIKKDGKKPIRYIFVQKKGKQTRVVVGAYSKPVVNPRGEIKGEDAGWIKTTTKHYGKDTDAWFIPKKGAVLSKKDVQDILKKF